MLSYFPEASSNNKFFDSSLLREEIVLQPQSTITNVTRSGLGSSLFARRYWGNILAFASFFSFPLGTKMFQFPRFAPLHIAEAISHYRDKVSPFGNLRIKAC